MYSLRDIELLIRAWATGKPVKVAVEGEWIKVTPDNLKAKVGDNWVTLREAIVLFDWRNDA
jgi:hypothetical protein